MKIEFYKETEFKDTEIGRIPKDWEVSKLEKVLTFKNGRRPVISENGNIPIFGANGIMGFTNDFLVENDFTLVIGRVGASGQVHLGKGKLWVSDNAIYTEKYDKEIIYLPFLYYLLIYKKLNQYSSKTTHPIITQTFLNNFFVSFPPLLEQKAIAEILSTVDEAIQKTNEVIAKTERLKKGLMQELLTKGIGHKEFKDTEIGRIPKTWKIVKLGEITKKIKDIDHKMPEKVSYGIPFVSVKYMLKHPDYNFSLNPKDPDIEFISEEDYLYHKQRFDAEKEDIVYSRFGTIGYAKLIQTSDPFIASYSIVLIKPKKDLVFPLFLVYVLNSEKLRLQAKIATKGATNQNLHLEDIQNLRVPLPPIEEQKRIAEIILTVDKKLELERNEKAKLERIKQGLMNLLLTGKVRVKLKET